MATVEQLCRSYLDLRYHFDPVEASLAGATTFDGRLGSFGAEAMRAHLAAFRALTGAIEEVDTASLADEIDRTALLDDCRMTAFVFEHEQPHLRQPGFWLQHLFGSIHALMAREGEPAAVAPMALDRLTAAPGFLGDARATIESPAGIFVDAALASLGGGGELIARAAQHFGAATPDLAEPLTAAAHDALEALTTFGRALTSEIAPSDDPLAHAVGEVQFERHLHHEHALRGGAPELWRYGARLMEETEAEVQRAAALIDDSRPWQAVVEHLRGEAPQGDVMDAFRAELARAEEFVSRHGLVPPVGSPLALERTPHYLASLVPFAAYLRASAETGGTARFLVTMPDDALGLAPVSQYELPTLVAHEAIPGHHQQISTALGLGSLVRQRVSTPIMTEGWALYAETLMNEYGYFDSPETRLFHLLDLHWRAARIVIDVGLHTRGMTPLEAIEMLLQAMPMERRNAEAEVRRYCTMPTYQLAYAIGRRDILALRDDWRARMGEAAPIGDFHTELLSYGGLPVALARWGMGYDE